MELSSRNSASNELVNLAWDNFSARSDGDNESAAIARFDIHASIRRCQYSRNQSNSLHAHKLEQVESVLVVNVTRK